MVTLGEKQKEREREREGERDERIFRMSPAINECLILMVVSYEKC
jgi:hypothetical protein